MGVPPDTLKDLRSPASSPDLEPERAWPEEFTPAPTPDPKETINRVLRDYHQVAQDLAARTARVAELERRLAATMGELQAARRKVGSLAARLTAAEAAADAVRSELEEERGRGEAIARELEELRRSLK